ncbi:hypothetical protein BH10PAT2_BH10PAT2_0140 [soil metagenome]
MITHTLIAQKLDFRTAAGAQKLPYGDGASSVGSVVSSLLTAIMAIAILAVFIYLVTAGFEWITAGGDKGKIEAARNKITSSIVGLIVLSAVIVIILLVQKFLNISIIKVG